MEYIDSEIAKIKNSVAAQRERLIEIENQVIFQEKSKEEEIESLERVIDEKDSIIQSKELGNQELKEKIGSIQTEINEKNQKIQENEQKIIDLSTEIKSLNSKLADAENQLDELNKNLGILKDEIASKNEEKVKLEQSLEDLKLKSDLAINNEREKFENQIKELSNKLESQNEEFSVQKQKMELNIDELLKVGEKLHVFIGEKQFLTQINEMVRSAKVRLLLITPKLEFISNLDFSNLDSNLSITIATKVNMNIPEHKQIVNDLKKNFNFNIKYYDFEDLWGIKIDGESLFIASRLENGEFFGFYTSDVNIVNQFSSIVTDALVRAKKINF